ncbi:hypothetical protein PVAP13_2NG448403 [Panicum virgatum]|uniref:Late embryogenesis abundant protein LEA-2 subgroup domain-containing protein n=2 Tax=Panicum virgatum TaxID=38727 RepID=A0A8T0VME8_PANVG|nr:hypothetical protein PVAP13_2NG448403 [Panicum virgatum]
MHACAHCSVMPAIDAVHETPKRRGKRERRRSKRHKGRGRAPWPAAARTDNQASDATAMETSKKDNLCDMHRSRRRARVLAGALLAALLAAAALLAVYLTYRPAKPQVSVSRAAVYQLETAGNSSSPADPAAAAAPYAIAARAQFTLLLHNPSDRAAVLYDGLLAYVTYRGEPVAPPAELPAVVQELGADVALTPSFGGLGGGAGAEPVPVSEATVRALAGDCAARRVLLRLVLLGRVRYRSGLFRTGWRDLFVRCDVTTGVGVDAGAGGVPLLEYPQCFVDA